MSKYFSLVIIKSFIIIFFSIFNILFFVIIFIFPFKSEFFWTKSLSLNIGKFLNSSNSYFSEASIKFMKLVMKITFSLGGMFPIFIINLFSSVGSSLTKMAAFPDDMLSSYFISAFSFFIILDFTSIESPIFALKESKRISFFL